ncbi:MAG: ABC transporter ATP-binding protein [Gammaproteobacteria bacterium]
MTLRVTDLAFGYTGKPVGSGVSFSLQPGGVLCLLGPNGSGKTTLFKTILGLLEPQAGRIEIDGADISHWSRAQIARRMGYVPQAQSSHFPFTVLETVLMGRTAHIGLFASPSHHDVAVADRALATLNIEHLRDVAYTEISGGERQLTLIARALAQEPAILVMDEPTASLDFGNQAMVLAKVRQLASQDMAVIFASHDPDHAFQCATDVALLYHGRLVQHGPAAQVITPGNLKQLYDVDVEIIELAGGRRAGQPLHVCVPAPRGQ